jgi:hypothetical protein
VRAGAGHAEPGGRGSARGCGSTCAPPADACHLVQLHRRCLLSSNTPTPFPLPPPLARRSNEQWRGGKSATRHVPTCQLPAWAWAWAWAMGHGPAQSVSPEGEGTQGQGQAQGQESSRAPAHTFRRRGSSVIINSTDTGAVLSYVWVCTYAGK